MSDDRFEETINTFVRRLEFLRRVNDIKKQDIGKIIGVNRVTYHRLTKGERTPSLEALIKASNYFDMSADCLLGFSDVEKPMMEVLDEISKRYNIPIDELMEITKISGVKEDIEDYWNKRLLLRGVNLTE
jgi:transcriptional regulator with XRE-family HTH domain